MAACLYLLGEGLCVAGFPCAYTKQCNIASTWNVSFFDAKLMLGVGITLVIIGGGAMFYVVFSDDKVKACLAGTKGSDGSDEKDVHLI